MVPGSMQLSGRTLTRMLHTICGVCRFRGIHKSLARSFSTHRSTSSKPPKKATPRDITENRVYVENRTKEFATNMFSQQAAVIANVLTTEAKVELDEIVNTAKTTHFSDRYLHDWFSSHGAQGLVYIISRCYDHVPDYAWTTFFNLLCGANTPQSVLYNFSAFVALRPKLSLHIIYKVATTYADTMSDDTALDLITTMSKAGFTYSPDLLALAPLPPTLMHAELAPARAAITSRPRARERAAAMLKAMSIGANAGVCAHLVSSTLPVPAQTHTNSSGASSPTGSHTAPLPAYITIDANSAAICFLTALTLRLALRPQYLDHWRTLAPPSPSHLTTAFPQPSSPLALPLLAPPPTLYLSPPTFLAPARQMAHDHLLTTYRDAAALPLLALWARVTRHTDSAHVEHVLTHAHTETQTPTPTQTHVRGTSTDATTHSAMGTVAAPLLRDSGVTFSVSEQQWASLSAEHATLPPPVSNTTTNNKHTNRNDNPRKGKNTSRQSHATTSSESLPSATTAPMDGLTPALCITSLTAPLPTRPDNVPTAHTTDTATPGASTGRSLLRVDGHALTRWSDCYAANQLLADAVQRAADAMQTLSTLPQGAEERRAALASAHAWVDGVEAYANDAWTQIVPMFAVGRVVSSDTNTATDGHARVNTVSSSTPASSSNGKTLQVPVTQPAASLLVHTSGKIAAVAGGGHIEYRAAAAAESVADVLGGLSDSTTKLGHRLTVVRAKLDALIKEMAVAVAAATVQGLPYEGTPVVDGSGAALRRTVAMRDVLAVAGENGLWTQVHDGVAAFLRERGVRTLAERECAEVMQVLSSMEGQEVATDGAAGDRAGANAAANAGAMDAQGISRVLCDYAGLLHTHLRDYYGTPRVPRMHPAVAHAPAAQHVSAQETVRLYEHDWDAGDSARLGKRASQAKGAEREVVDGTVANVAPVALPAGTLRDMASFGYVHVDYPGFERLHEATHKTTHPATATKTEADVEEASWLHKLLPRGELMSGQVLSAEEQRAHQTHLREQSKGIMGSLAKLVQGGTASAAGDAAANTPSTSTSTPTSSSFSTSASSNAKIDADANAASSSSSSSEATPPVDSIAARLPSRPTWSDDLLADRDSAHALSPSMAPQHLPLALDSSLFVAPPSADAPAVVQPPMLTHLFPHGYSAPMHAGYTATALIASTMARHATGEDAGIRATAQSTAAASESASTPTPVTVAADANSTAMKHAATPVHVPGDTDPLATTAFHRATGLLAAGARSRILWRWDGHLGDLDMDVSGLAAPSKGPQGILSVLVQSETHMITTGEACVRALMLAEVKTFLANVSCSVCDTTSAANRTHTATTAAAGDGEEARDKADGSGIAANTDAFARSSLRVSTVLGAYTRACAEQGLVAEVRFVSFLVDTVNGLLHSLNAQGAAHPRHAVPQLRVPDVHKSLALALIRDHAAARSQEHVMAALQHVGVRQYAPDTFKGPVHTPRNFAPQEGVEEGALLAMGDAVWVARKRRAVERAVSATAHGGNATATGAITSTDSGSPTASGTASGTAGAGASDSPIVTLTPTAAAAAATTRGAASSAGVDGTASEAVSTTTHSFSTSSLSPSMSMSPSAPHAQSQPQSLALSDDADRRARVRRITESTTPKVTTGAFHTTRNYSSISASAPSFSSTTASNATTDSTTAAFPSSASTPAHCRAMSGMSVSLAAQPLRTRMLATIQHVLLFSTKQHSGNGKHRSNSDKAGANKPNTTYNNGNHKKNDIKARSSDSHYNSGADGDHAKGHGVDNTHTGGRGVFRDLLAKNAADNARANALADAEALRPRSLVNERHVNEHHTGDYVDRHSTSTSASPTTAASARPRHVWPNCTSKTPNSRYPQEQLYPDDFFDEPIPTVTRDRYPPHAKTTSIGAAAGVPDTSARDPRLPAAYIMLHNGEVTAEALCPTDVTAPTGDALHDSDAADVDARARLETQLREVLSAFETRLREDATEAAQARGHSLSTEMGDIDAQVRAQCVSFAEDVSRELEHQGEVWMLLRWQAHVEATYACVDASECIINAQDTNNNVTAPTAITGTAKDANVTTTTPTATPAGAAAPITGVIGSLVTPFASLGPVPLAPCFAPLAPASTAQADAPAEATLSLFADTMSFPPQPPALLSHPLATVSATALRTHLGLFRAATHSHTHRTLAIPLAARCLALYERVMQQIELSPALLTSSTPPSALSPLLRGLVAADSPASPAALSRLLTDLFTHARTLTAEPAVATQMQWCTSLALTILKAWRAHATHLPDLHITPPFAAPFDIPAGLRAQVVCPVPTPALATALAAFLSTSAAAHPAHCAAVLSAYTAQVTALAPSSRHFLALYHAHTDRIASLLWAHAHAHTQPSSPYYLSPEEPLAARTPPQNNPAAPLPSHTDEQRAWLECQQLPSHQTHLPTVVARVAGTVATALAAPLTIASRTTPIPSSAGPLTLARVAPLTRGKVASTPVVIAAAHQTASLVNTGVLAFPLTLPTAPPALSVASTPAPVKMAPAAAIAHASAEPLTTTQRRNAAAAEAEAKAAAETVAAAEAAAADVPTLDVYDAAHTAPADAAALDAAALRSLTASETDITGASTTAPTASSTAATTTSTTAAATASSTTASVPRASIWLSRPQLTAGPTALPTLTPSHFIAGGAGSLPSRVAAWERDITNRTTFDHPLVPFPIAYPAPHYPRPLSPTLPSHIDWRMAVALLRGLLSHPVPSASLLRAHMPLALWYKQAFIDLHATARQKGFLAGAGYEGSPLQRADTLLCYFLGAAPTADANGATLALTDAYLAYTAITHKHALAFNAAVERVASLPPGSAAHAVAEAAPELTLAPVLSFQAHVGGPVQRVGVEAVEQLLVDASVRALQVRTAQNNIATNRSARNASSRDGLDFVVCQQPQVQSLFRAPAKELPLGVNRALEPEEERVLRAVIEECGAVWAAGGRRQVRALSFYDYSARAASRIEDMAEEEAVEIEEEAVDVEKEVRAEVGVEVEVEDIDDMADTEHVVGEMKR